MAGKRAKCPECSQVLRLPEIHSAEQKTIAEVVGEPIDQKLMKLFAASDFRRAAALMNGFRFWLISLEQRHDVPLPLIAKVKEGAAMLAFTSKNMLAKFVEIKISAEQREHVNAFEVDGSSIFQPLENDVCLLINAESKSALLLDPDCIIEIQDHWKDLSILPSAVNDFA